MWSGGVLVTRVAVLEEQSRFRSLRPSMKGQYTSVRDVQNRTIPKLCQQRPVFLPEDRVDSDEPSRRWRFPTLNKRKDRLRRCGDRIFRDNSGAVFFGLFFSESVRAFVRSKLRLAAAQRSWRQPLLVEPIRAPVDMCAAPTLRTKRPLHSTGLSYNVKGRAAQPKTRV